MPSDPFRVGRDRRTERQPLQDVAFDAGLAIAHISERDVQKFTREGKVDVRETTRKPRIEFTAA